MKKILMGLIFFSWAVLSFSEEKSVENRIEKFNQYKKLVNENREKEIKRNLPSPEEMRVYYTQERLRLDREKLEYEKKLAYERAEAERRRDNLINTAIIGGIGYGGYRIGRHHHWW